MFIDKTKDGLQNLLDLINLANGTSLVKNVGVEFSAPVAHAGPSGHNTKITVTGDENQSYEGTQDLYYTRIGLDDNVAMPPVRWPIDAATTPAAFLTQVADGLNLVPSELAPIASIPYQALTVELTPIANSLLYAGVLTLALKWLPDPYHVYLMDTFDGNGSLLNRVPNVGGIWFNGGPNAEAQDGATSGGYLDPAPGKTVFRARNNTLVGGEYVVEMEIFIGVEPDANNSDIYFYCNLDPDTSNFSGWYIDFNNDGQIDFGCSRFPGSTVYTNGTWTSGAHKIRLETRFTSTILFWDDVEVGRVEGSKPADTMLPYWIWDNGDTPQSLRIDKVTVRRMDGLEEPPFLLWSREWTPPDGSLYELYYADFSRDKLWYGDGKTLIAADTTTGNVVATLDINAFAGLDAGTNYGYRAPPELVRGFELWLTRKLSGGFTANVPSVIRVDVANNVFTTSIGGSVSATEKYSHVGYREHSSVAMIRRKSDGTYQLININPDTGAITQSYPFTVLAQGIQAAYYDNMQDMFWISDTDGSNRIRMMRAGPGTWGDTSITPGSFAASTITTVKWWYPSTVFYGTDTAVSYYMSVFEQDGATHKLTLLSLVNYNVALSVDLAKPGFDIGAVNNFQITQIVWHGLTRELFVRVEYQKPGDTSFTGEVWAYDAYTLQYTRTVVGDGDMPFPLNVLSDGNNTYTLNETTTPDNVSLNRLYLC